MLSMDHLENQLPPVFDPLGGAVWSLKPVMILWAKQLEPTNRSFSWDVPASDRINGLDHWVKEYSK